MNDIRNVTVVGAGLMGHGIAQVFACAGLNVTITDTQAATLEVATARIRDNLLEMGIAPIPVLEKIQLSSNLRSAVTSADIIIEAATEKVDLKQQLFADIAAAAPAHAILASNTSVIPITLCGQKLDQEARGRLVGTHWWNPPHLIPLVEVVRTTDTRTDVFEATFELLHSVGKCPVKVQRDVAGFIGNRLQHALWREAIHLVESGVCDAETIDTVVKGSFGQRMPVLGPMENADLVGLELTREVHRILFPHLDCSKQPSPLLEELISSGNLGMRSGKGLRAWTPDSIEKVQRDLNEHLITMNRTNEQQAS